MLFSDAKFLRLKTLYVTSLWAIEGDQACTKILQPVLHMGLIIGPHASGVDMSVPH